MNNWYILVFIAAPNLNGDIIITNVSATGDFIAPAIDDDVTDGIAAAFDAGLELENIEAIDNGRVQYTFYCYKQCNSGCYNTPYRPRC